MKKKSYSRRLMSRESAGREKEFACRNGFGWSQPGLRVLYSVKAKDIAEGGVK
jgi:hypothetical protein